MLSPFELAKYLPGAACLAGFCWLLFSSNKRLLSMRRQLPMLSLVMALLTVGALASTFVLQTLPAHAMPRDDCLNSPSASTCTGVSPTASVCSSSNAVISNFTPVIDSTQPSKPQVGTLRIWYSYDCQTNWAQFIGGYDTTAIDKNNKLSTQLDADVKSGKSGQALDQGNCSYKYDGANSATIALATTLNMVTADGSNTPAQPNSGVSNQLQSQNNLPCTAFSPMIFAPTTPSTAILAVVVGTQKTTWSFSTILQQVHLGGNDFTGSSPVNLPGSTSVTPTTVVTPGVTPTTTTSSNSPIASQTAAVATATAAASATASATSVSTATATPSATSTPPVVTGLSGMCNGTTSSSSSWQTTPINGATNNKNQCTDNSTISLTSSGKLYGGSGADSPYYVYRDEPLVHKTQSGSTPYIYKALVKTVMDQGSGHAGDGGIMLRVNLGPSSPYVALMVNKSGTAYLETRTTVGDNSVTQQSTSIPSQPGHGWWLIMQMSYTSAGDVTITGSAISADVVGNGSPNIQGMQLGPSVTISSAQVKGNKGDGADIRVGLAVAGNDDTNNQPTTVLFSNMQ